jgi:antibiotic biosynthesis monooxygenase (ABM) superfamily enzyme
MNAAEPISTSQSHLPLEVQGTRASSVILQRVPADRTDAFMEWQRGITGAAEEFAGYRATDVYPPADPRRPEWVVVIHFDDATYLQAWLDSPERSAWIARLPKGIGDARVRMLPHGFGAWFAGLVDGSPASWQMALTVVLGLYPTVMLLNLVVGSYLSRVGLAVSMLIGNALSVSILQWGVMPLLERGLRPWLHADLKNQRAVLIGGSVGIIVLLAATVLLFRQVTG